MKFQLPKASTSVILTVFIQDSSVTTGAGLAGLIESSSITGGYVKRDGLGIALAVDENVTTEGTYQAPSAAAKVRIGTPANMPAGFYELHFHNDLFTTADWVTMGFSGASNMAPLTLEIQLTSVDLNDAADGGMSNLADWVDGGRLDLILDIIAADTTTDIPALLGTPTDFGSGTSTLAANLQDLADNGTAVYDRATDSLQAVRDRGDAAWVTGAGGTGLTALGEGTAQSGTASTIVLAGASTFADDELNGNVINILTGTGAGQSRVILSNTLSDDTCNVYPNWATNPGADSTYEIVQGSINVSAISLDGGAADASKLQWNGTGLLGDPFPLRQDQGASISGGLAVRSNMASVTAIQGSEQDLVNTNASDDTRWTGDDDGAGAEFIFLCTPADTTGAPGDLHFEGYYDEPVGATNGATISLYNFQSAAWEAHITLTNASSDEIHDVPLAHEHGAPGSGTLETVAYTIGDVLIKVEQDTQETGNACLLIDRMYVGFISAPVTAAEMADAVWDEPIAGHVAAGSFGKTDADILADTDNLQTSQGNWLTATGFSTHDAAAVYTAFGDGSNLTALATATGFNTVVPDVAGTAAGLHTTTDAAIAAVKTDTGNLVTTVGAAGAGLTAINLPNQTMDIVGSITGNLSGTVGSVTGAVGSVTADVTTDAASRTASKADVSALALEATVGTVKTDTAAILVDTGTAGVVVASGSKTGYALSATGADLVLVDGKTLPAALRIIAAGVIGKVSGAGTGTEVFVGLDAATTRATVTVDASGNRTAVVYG